VDVSDANSEGQPVIVLMSWDLRAGTLTAQRSDNRTATVRDLLPGGPTRIVKIDWSEVLGGVVIYVDTGEEIALELPSYPHVDQLDGRRVVYLDQNHWSTFAKAIRDPDRVSEPDARAAERLAELVRDRKVVIPMSRGHHVETTQYGDDANRFNLAITMLQVSRGWQMRAPLGVRHDEMYGAFRARFATPARARARDVFTLEPYATSTGVEATPGGADIPPRFDFMRQALEAVTTMIDVMLDVDVIDRADIDFWVAAQQRFTASLAAQLDLTRDQRRKRADRHLLNDFHDELATAAIEALVDSEQFEEWFGDANADALMRDMKSVNVYRLVQRSKHMTTGTRWTANDLMDMTYLCCAAAYADYVVAERHQAGLLSQVSPAEGRRATVFRNLPLAVSALEDTITGGR
jgi:hypothetical protein